MRIFITADVHHGMAHDTDHLTEALASYLADHASADDTLVIGGDLACADTRGLVECFSEFADFPGSKAFVPGNHDLWSAPDGGQGSGTHRDREGID